MKWFIKAFRQYADFSGRASRQEFWMFVLFNLLLAMAWALVAGLLTGLLGDSFDHDSDRLIFMYKLIAIYYAVTAVPAMAVGVRRLHDTGRSGWWMLVSLVPIAGGIWLILLMCLDGSAGDNRYGSRPDGTTDIVPKPVLQQKALMWLTAFAVFGVYVCLLNLVDILFSTRYQWHTGAEQLNMLRPLLGSFLISVSFIVMGIAFLQKRDYSRTVGGWIVAAYVIRLIPEIRWASQIADFHINIWFVLNIMLFLAFILYGGLLLARKGRLPLANYVLMAASGCCVILTFWSM
uniref:DUF805 domain-containing protein n=2 Tax=Prevotella heparinolytica TaxID=28113 RepID=UPI0035A047B4